MKEWNTVHTPYLSRADRAMSSETEIVWFADRHTYPYLREDIVTLSSPTAIDEDWIKPGRIIGCAMLDERTPPRNPDSHYPLWDRRFWYVLQLDPFGTDFPYLPGEAVWTDSIAAGVASRDPTNEERGDHCKAYFRQHPDHENKVIKLEDSSHERAVFRRRKQERSGLPDWWGEQKVLEEGERLTVPLSAIVAQVVKWQWDGRIPLGAITVIDGDPGLGKSTLTLDLAARLTTGQTMPGDGHGAGAMPPGNVLLLTVEDSLAHTVRPRLEAAGADVDRVHVFDQARLEGALPTMPSHQDEILSMIRATQARMVIVDPFVAFLDEGLSYNNDQDVRRAMAAWAAIAEKTGAAIVLIRHLNKRAGGSSLYRGGGSIGIIGAARSGLVVAKDPADPARRILAVNKSNLGVGARSLVFAVEAADNTSRIAWRGESDLTAEELLDTPPSAEERSAIDEAIDFLRDLLSDQKVRDGYGMLAGEVMGHAKTAGISQATLNRAKRALGVVPHRVGFGGDGRYYWRLPRAKPGDKPA